MAVEHTIDEYCEHCKSVNMMSANVHVVGKRCGNCRHFDGDEYSHGWCLNPTNRHPPTGVVFPNGFSPSVCYTGKCDSFETKTNL